MCAFSKKKTITQSSLNYRFSRRLVVNSPKTEQEIFEECKVEICNLLGIDKVLIEHDIESQNMMALPKWASDIRDVLQRNNGRYIMNIFEKHLQNKDHQLAAIYDEVQPIVALFKEMNKEGLMFLTSLFFILYISCIIKYMSCYMDYAGRDCLWITACPAKH